MDVTAGTLTERCQLTQIFATSQDGNVCKSVACCKNQTLSLALCTDHWKGARSWVLVILQPFPFRSGELAYRERMLKGVAVGTEEASREEQRCPLGQTLCWVLRTQR